MSPLTSCATSRAGTLCANCQTQRILWRDIVALNGSAHPRRRCRTSKPAGGFEKERPCSSVDIEFHPIRAEAACRIFVTTPGNASRVRNLAWIAPLFNQTNTLRSSARYWIASLMCSGRMAAAAPRSAIVRATFRIRSYARAERPSLVIAILSSSSPASSI